jgi:hypothetical protein
MTSKPANSFCLRIYYLRLRQTRSAVMVGGAKTSVYSWLPDIHTPPIPPYFMRKSGIRQESSHSLQMTQRTATIFLGEKKKNLKKKSII